MTREWRSCKGYDHAYTPPPADSEWHTVICACGEVTLRLKHTPSPNPVENHEGYRAVP